MKLFSTNTNTFDLYNGATFESFVKPSPAHELSSLNENLWLPNNCQTENSGVPLGSSNNFINLIGLVGIPTEINREAADTNIQQRLPTTTTLDSARDSKNEQGNHVQRCAWALRIDECICRHNRSGCEKTLISPVLDVRTQPSSTIISNRKEAKSSFATHHGKKEKKNTNLVVSSKQHQKNRRKNKYGNGACCNNALSSVSVTNVSTLHSQACVNQNFNVFAFTCMHNVEAQSQQKDENQNTHVHAKHSTMSSMKTNSGNNQKRRGTQTNSPSSVNVFVSTDINNDLLRSLFANQAENDGRAEKHNRKTFSDKNEDNSSLYKCSENQSKWRNNKTLKKEASQKQSSVSVDNNEATFYISDSYHENLSHKSVANEKCLKNYENRNRQETDIINSDEIMEKIKKHISKLNEKRQTKYILDRSKSTKKDKPNEAGSCANYPRASSRYNGANKSGICDSSRFNSIRAQIRGKDNEFNEVECEGGNASSSINKKHVCSCKLNIPIRQNDVELHTPKNPRCECSVNPSKHCKGCLDCKKDLSYHNNIKYNLNEISGQLTSGVQPEELRASLYNRKNWNRNKSSFLKTSKDDERWLKTNSRDLNRSLNKNSQGKAVQTIFSAINNLKTRSNEEILLCPCSKCIDNHVAAIYIAQTDDDNLVPKKVTGNTTFKLEKPPHTTQNQNKNQKRSCMFFKSKNGPIKMKSKGNIANKDSKSRENKGCRTTKSRSSVKFPNRKKEAPSIPATQQPRIGSGYQKFQPYSHHKQNNLPCTTEYRDLANMSSSPSYCGEVINIHNGTDSYPRGFCSNGFYYDNTIKNLEHKISELELAIQRNKENCRVVIPEACENRIESIENMNTSDESTPDTSVSQKLEQEVDTKIVVCPSNCWHEAEIKIIRGKIEKFEKTYPLSCCKESSIKLLQDKISELEMAFINYSQKNSQKPVQRREKADQPNKKCGYCLKSGKTASTSKNGSSKREASITSFQSQQSETSNVSKKSQSRSKKSWYCLKSNKKEIPKKDTSDTSFLSKTSISNASKKSETSVSPSTKKSWYCPNKSKRKTNLTRDTSKTSFQYECKRIESPPCLAQESVKSKNSCKCANKPTLPKDSVKDITGNKSSCCSRPSKVTIKSENKDKVSRDASVALYQSNQNNKLSTKSDERKSCTTCNISNQSNKCCTCKNDPPYCWKEVQILREKIENFERTYPPTIFTTEAIRSLQRKVDELEAALNKNRDNECPAPENEQNNITFSASEFRNSSNSIINNFLQLSVYKNLDETFNKGISEEYVKDLDQTFSQHSKNDSANSNKKNESLTALSNSSEHSINVQKISVPLTNPEETSEITNLAPKKCPEGCYNTAVFKDLRNQLESHEKTCLRNDSFLKKMQGKMDTIEKMLIIRQRNKSSQLTDLDNEEVLEIHQPRSVSQYEKLDEKRASKSQSRDIIKSSLETLYEVTTSKENDVGLSDASDIQSFASHVQDGIHSSTSHTYNRSGFSNNKIDTNRKSDWIRKVCKSETQTNGWDNNSNAHKSHRSDVATNEPVSFIMPDLQDASLKNNSNHQAIPKARTSMKAFEISNGIIDALEIKKSHICDSDNEALNQNGKLPTSSIIKNNISFTPDKELPSTISFYGNELSSSTKSELQTTEIKKDFSTQNDAPEIELAKLESSFIIRESSHKNLNASTFNDKYLNTDSQNTSIGSNALLKTNHEASNSTRDIFTRKDFNIPTSRRNSAVASIASAKASELVDPLEVSSKTGNTNLKNASKIQETLKNINYGQTPAEIKANDTKTNVALSTSSDLHNSHSKESVEYMPNREVYSNSQNQIEDGTRSIIDNMNGSRTNQTLQSKTGSGNLEEATSETAKDASEKELSNAFVDQSMTNQTSAIISNDDFKNISSDELNLTDSTTVGPIRLEVAPKSENEGEDLRDPLTTSTFSLSSSTCDAEKTKNLLVTRDLKTDESTALRKNADGEFQTTFDSSVDITNVNLSNDNFLNGTESSISTNKKAKTHKEYISELGHISEISESESSTHVVTRIPEVGDEELHKDETSPLYNESTNSKEDDNLQRNVKSAVKFGGRQDDIPVSKKSKWSYSKTGVYGVKSRSSYKAMGIGDQDFNKSFDSIVDQSYSEKTISSLNKPSKYKLQSKNKHFDDEYTRSSSSSPNRPCKCNETFSRLFHFKDDIKLRRSNKKELSAYKKTSKLDLHCKEEKMDISCKNTEIIRSLQYKVEALEKTKSVSSAEAVKTLENKINSWLENACIPNSCAAFQHLEEKVKALETIAFGNNGKAVTIKELQHRIEELEKACTPNEINMSTIKNLQDKIEAFERVCPPECYNVEIVRSIQGKIEELENMFKHQMGCRLKKRGTIKIFKEIPQQDGCNTSNCTWINSSSHNGELKRRDSFTAKFKNFKLFTHSPDKLNEKKRKPSLLHILSRKSACTCTNTKLPPSTNPYILPVPVCIPNISTQLGSALSGTQEHQLVKAITEELELQRSELKELKLLLKSYLDKTDNSGKFCRKFGGSLNNPYVQYATICSGPYGNLTYIPMKKSDSHGSSSTCNKSASQTDYSYYSMFDWSASYNHSEIQLENQRCHSCPTCCATKVIGLQDMSKSEVIRGSYKNKYKTTIQRNHKRKNHWLLLFCKFCNG